MRRAVGEVDDLVRDRVTVKVRVEVRVRVRFRVSVRVRVRTHGVAMRSAGRRRAAGSCAAH